MAPDSFLAGLVIGMILTMITGSLYVMKPRFDELMAQRDHWRARAIHAEDAGDAQADATMGRITGIWGDAMDGEPE